MMEAWQTLLIHLFKEGRSWVSQMERSDWRRVIADMRGTQDDQPLSIIQTEAEAIGWIRSVTTELRKGFVIAPDRKRDNILMLLAPISEVIGPNLKLDLHLGIILVDKNRSKRFFGYRFESPGGFEEHNYYHAQPIQSFVRGTRNINSIPWYPDTFPTFPLDATNGVELIATMLLSYRKLQSLNDLAASGYIGQAVKDPLRVFLDRIRGAGV